MRLTSSRFKVGAIALALALGLTACAGEDGSEPSDETTDEGAEDEAPESDEGDGDAQADGEPIVVGVSAALTGPGATFAEVQVNGVTTWQEDVNAAGGIDGRPVELDVCDDEGSPEGSSRCANDFLSDGREIVIHLSFTGAVRAAHEVLDGVLVVNSSPNVQPPTDSTFFQAAPSVLETSQAIFDFAQENGIEKIGLLAATDASGEEAIASFRKALPDDLELVEARIDPEDVQATGQLATLDEEDVGLVALSFSGSGAVSVVRGYANLGLDVPLILNSANVAENFLQLIEGFRPERLFGAPQVPTLDATALEAPFSTRTQDFDEAHMERFGERPDHLTYTGRFAGDIVGTALTEVGSDAGPEAWAEYLRDATIESLVDFSYDSSTDTNVPQDWGLYIVERVEDNWVRATL